MSNGAHLSTISVSLLCQSSRKLATWATWRLCEGDTIRRVEDWSDSRQKVPQSFNHCRTTSPGPYPESLGSATQLLYRGMWRSDRQPQLGSVSKKQSCHLPQ